MTGTLELDRISLPQVTPVTDSEIVAYLRRSHQIADITTQVETESLSLQLCEQFGITVSDEEWQAAGDAFRLEHKLLGISETQAWLQQQRISVEDWSQGIKTALLVQKLKEQLFGLAVDGHYMTNREDYRRVALSQILVLDLTEALKIARSLRDNQASFCALALVHSKGKQSQENGGFVGIRFISELAPEIAQAVTNAKEGEILGPIHTSLGYHVLRIEKWFPTELNQAVREQILNSLFQVWLHQQTIGNAAD